MNELREEVIKIEEKADTAPQVTTSANTPSPAIGSSSVQGKKKKKEDKKKKKKIIIIIIKKKEEKKKRKKKRKKERRNGNGPVHFTIRLTPSFRCSIPLFDSS